MTNMAVVRSLRKRFLERPSGAEPDPYAAFAEMAEAYVANTLEAICRIDAANPSAMLDPVLAARMAEVRAKLEGLDDLIVRLRQMQAEDRD